MQFEVTIRFDSKEELMEYLTGQSATESAEPIVEQTASEPKRRGRKTNAEKAAEPQKAAEPEATPEPAKTYALSDLHKAGTAYLNKNGMEAMMKLMGKYGALRTGEIKEEDRGKFIADCDNNVVVP